MSLDIKTKELVAIGASVAAKCQPCLKYHLKLARESGVSEEDLKSAIQLARMVRSKSAKFMDEFADESLEDKVESSVECGEGKRSKSACC